MKECKVVPITGKNSSEFAEQINSMLKGGWILQGSLGKHNMILIFTRNIKITEEE